MHVIHSINALPSALQAWWRQGSRIGFVPTMGHVHAGHLALLARARAECEQVICSIFVNPEQFNKKEDYINYPRTWQADVHQIEATGCDILFSPSVDEIYPNSPRIQIDFGTLTEEMEGRDRPGHFSGVAVVLSKFFHLLRPRVVYLGEKDWQQCLLVKQLVEELNFNLEVVTVPTVRAKDGLAFSSRNIHLTDVQRTRATCLYATLCRAATELKCGHSPEQVKMAALAQLQSVPGVVVDYFEIVDSYMLAPIVKISQHKCISLCLAVRVGAVRLIDNIHFTIPIAKS